MVLVNKITIVKFSLNIDYWKKSVKRGMPFFLPALVALVGSRIGIVMLSKMSGDVSVGSYGAANGLIDKLSVIPDGICTAVFPAIALLYQSSQEEAGKLFERIFAYLILIAFPIAIGVIVLAKPIILIIYGTKYLSSVLTLQILSLSLFLTFANSLLSWTLGAIHRERKSAFAVYIFTLVYVIMNLLLIPFFNETGVALAGLVSSITGFVIFIIMIRRYLTSSIIKQNTLLKIIVAGILMGILIFVLKNMNVIIVIVVGALFYILLALLFKIINRSDISKILDIFMKRNQTADKSEF